ncbi:DUF3298 and DUF4163 domain-containing protein [Aestuariibaculum suncheonense]|uniref:DUF3298 and DUF4163 domain-containing protein n=1 Tax=Aestuariibaculum suncheonense TaxID=1028745 RepID=A0A8J6Q9N5_9FLAO|nr:DUF3298 and DUF4163 domain-containing protein [Aestuariibaculum suncheonense]MBD0833943.1 DUF3298 and DUF4163 domain-containing protein [Aestuariibaculum suncheonense]
MSIKHLLFFFTTLFILYSCNEDSNTSFSIITITTPNNKLVEINIPNAEGDDAISNQINTEITKAVSAALHTGEGKPDNATTIEEKIEKFNVEYNNFVKDFPESTFPWEAQIDGEVIFQSPEVISISITSYMNTGGAHGTVHISFLNFDPTTGKRFENEVLFKNQETFKALAKRYFDESIEDKAQLFEPETFQLAQTIGFSEEGLILLYNTYEIASYSAGIIEYTIPAEKVNDVLAINSPY